MAHLYKNRLQHYAQKRNIPFPTYSTETQGPPHARLFKSQVTIDGNTYTAPAFSSTIKDAEHEAAKVAFLSLSADGPQEDDCLHKSLLQELAQKRGLVLPIYATNISGPPHTPLFVSTVEISGGSYVGEGARTKKQAEMNAAKVAYIALTEGGPGASNAIAISNIVGTLSSNPANLQTVTVTGTPQITEPAITKMETIINNGVGYSVQNAPGANNVTAISNIVGSSSSGPSSLQTVITHQIEPTVNNNVSYTIPDDPEKAKGYLELKDLQDAIEKRTMTLPPVTIDQAQPISAPDVVNLPHVTIHQPQIAPAPAPNVVEFAKPSNGSQNHVIEASEGSGSNGKIIQPFVKEAGLNRVMEAGRRGSKILIRPHVQGMSYDGPIQVSDNEWVAMEVPVDGGM